MLIINMRALTLLNFHPEGKHFNHVVDFPAREHCAMSDLFIQHTAEYGQDNEMLG